MNAPLSYLTGVGIKAHHIVPLTWFMLIVSVVTSLIFAWLVVAGIRRTSLVPVDPTRDVVRTGNGIRWITGSLILTAIPLVIVLIWTMAAIADTGVPPANPALVLSVTPRQWWWEVRYEGQQPSDTFVTANEIHIPVGLPVLVKLKSPDVIHSFWVPQLSGKTDAIPGQTNVTWLQADRPGRFRGACTEFCGAQHAHMGFEVVAEPKAAFEAWRQRQLQTAPPPATAAQAHGLALVQFRCALCHTVRGTIAGSSAGPDLTHLMSRATIAATVFPNNRGSLAGWIQSPQTVKPGTLMPDQHLSAQQLNDVTAYLETLK
jgi:cytochrome c oxidase subunit 2